MIFYIALTSVVVKTVFCYLYPVEYETMLTICKNKINTFKENVETQIMSLSYNLIYCYSSTQIYLNKITRFVSPYVSKIVKIIKETCKEETCKEEIQRIKHINHIECIYKGNYICTPHFIHSSNYVFDRPFLCDHDFGGLLEKYGEKLDDVVFDLIIVSDDNVNSLKNKILYTNTKMILAFDEYTISNIKFFAVELTYRDEIFLIELNSKKDNYYIVNNVLNKAFFKYYLTIVLEIDIDYNNFDYTVTIIDHNVNLIKLTPNDYLIIKKDDYEIKTINNVLENLQVNDAHNKPIKHSDETDYVNESDKSDDYIKSE